ncbi:19_t:CDS:1, partial [Racocetra fulgida]
LAAPPTTTDFSLQSTLSCIAAFIEFVSDPLVIKCLLPGDFHNLDPLLDPHSTALQKQNAITAFVSKVCPLNCTDTEIKQISERGSKIISKGCSKELEDKNPFVLAAFAGIELYPPLIKSLCLKENGTFCFIKDAITIANLPPTNFTKPFINPFADKVVFCDYRSFCVPCFQDIINTMFDVIFDPKNKDALASLITLLGILNVPITETELEQSKLFVMIKCGFKFLDNPSLNGNN